MLPSHYVAITWPFRMVSMILDYRVYSRRR